MIKGIYKILCYFKGRITFHKNFFLIKFQFLKAIHNSSASKGTEVSHLFQLIGFQFFVIYAEAPQELGMTDIFLTLHYFRAIFKIVCN